jgi:nucleotide-binding universal stress UspA family protein
MEIVVGFIPTPEGWAAIHAAADEALARDARLVVVNATRGDARSDLRRAQDDDLARLREVLDESHVEYEVLRSVGRSEAADELMDTAATRGADRIVIGVRRRSSVGKLILGSTAQRVVLGAPCPVLTVRA